MKKWHLARLAVYGAAACALASFSINSSLAVDVQGNATTVETVSPAATTAVQTPAVNSVNKDNSGETKSTSAVKLFMWKIEGSQGTVYLLGSIHALKPGCYPLPSEMETAFAKS